MRIRCIQNLLKMKEKNFALKDQFQDKIRRLEMDKEIQEKKVAKLQKEMLDLDREKYKVELKAKETIDEMKRSQRSSMNDVKGRVSAQSSMENKIVKSQMDLKKANKEIERLQEQLRYALGKQKNYSASKQTEEGSARKQAPEKPPKPEIDYEKQVMKQDVALLTDQC